MAIALLLMPVILTVGIAMWGISVYNDLVRLRNQMQNAFAQIDVQLKRRYELIPNLVETAKAYMKHERETLDAVITARNQGLAAMKALAASPNDPTAFKSLLQAEGSIGSLLRSLSVTMESYPELKANTTMSQLMEELTSTENKVSFARQAFNDAVTVYNTSRELFSGLQYRRSYGISTGSAF